MSFQIDAAGWLDIVGSPKTIGMIDEIAAALLSSPRRIDEIVIHLHDADRSVAWRTAWIIDKIAGKNAALIIPYHRMIVEVLKKTPHNGVRRHLTKILTDNITEACEDGELIDKCFGWIVHPKIPVAVKANVMQLLSNLCTIYPELKDELIMTIEAGLQDGSVGYRTKAKNIIRRLRKKPKDKIADLFHDIKIT